MPALVAPNIVRLTFEGTLADSTWANIMDVSLLGTSRPRAENCEILARAAFDAWSSGPRQQATNQTVLRTVSWVDLDSLNGSTGTVTGGTEVGPNPAGIRTDAPLSANTSVLVSKVVTAGRATRDGRWYQAGYAEPQCDATDLLPAYLSQAQAAFTVFLTNLTDPPDLAPDSAIPVVVHTENVGTPENPVIEFRDSTLIGAMVVRSRLATQRRRLRR